MSLRVRTVLLATLATTLVLVGAGVALLLGLRASLTEAAADAADLRAGELAGLAAQDRLPAPVPADPDEAVVQIVDNRRRVVAASAEAPSQPLDLPVPAVGQRQALRVRGLAGIPGNRDFQVVAQTVRTPRGEVVVYVAMSLDDVDEAVATTARILLLAVPLLVLVLSAGTWLLVGSTLSPIAAMSQRAAAIGVMDLAQRLPEPATHDEVGTLARTLNAMLTRLEDGVARQRRFVADAAHELRTPLAVLQVQVQTGGSADALATEVARLEQLADGLLLLARLGPDGVALHRRPVDLDDVVDRALRRCAVPVGVAVDLGGVRPAQVDGDPEVLERITANLLGNALRHAATLVRVTLTSRPDGVRLAVGDDGTGIAAGDRERVFEPFTRLDAARARDGAGAGLGLAIVRDGVRAHGGQVQVSRNGAGGAVFTVRLPRSSA